MIDNKLKIFRMAATLKHFTEAATALGMTQPNVTRQIALLEQEIGTPLFERDGRQVHLTDAGNALLKESDKLFHDTEQLLRNVRNAAKKMRHYRIGGTMTAGAYVLPSLLAGYMRENETVRLSLHLANTDIITDMLKTHRLDLALVEGPFERNCFFSEHLLDDELVVAAPPGSVKGKLSLKNHLIRKRRLILRESGSGTRFYFDRFFREHKELQNLLSTEEITEVNSFDAIKELVRNGFGITVISELAVREEASAGTLSITRFREGTIRRGMDFIHLPGNNLKFAEHFIAYCRRTWLASHSN